MEYLQSILNLWSFDALKAWLLALPVYQVYATVFFYMFLESVVVVIPSEVLMVLSGYMVYIGKLNLILVIAISALGNVAGSLVLFWAARVLNRHRVVNLILKVAKKEQLNRAERFFKQRGRVAVFLAQLVPGIRTLISLPAGFFGMPLLPFVLYTYTGAFLWNSIWIGLSYRFGGATEWVLRVLSGYQHWVYAGLGATAVLITAYYLVKWLASRKNNMA